MKIVKEARREHKVEKAAVSKKESKTEYAEHTYEPAVGTGNTAVLMTEKPLKDANYEAGTFDKRMKEKRKHFETCSGNSKRKQTLIFGQPMKKKIFGQPMKKKPKLFKTESGKLERKQRAPIEVSDSGCPGSDSDLKPGMDIKAFELDKKMLAFSLSFFSGRNPRKLPPEGRKGEFPKLRFVPPSEEAALGIDLPII